LAQQDPRAWHTGEDAELERYLHVTTRFDDSFVPVGPLPWLWMVIGLAGLGVALFAGAVTVTGLAIALGGILLAFNALNTIVGGTSTLVNSIIASEQVTPLFDAAARYTPISPAVLEQSWRGAGPVRASREPVLRARNLVYRYHPHGRAVLRDIDLDIFAGDRLLLEGPSGGGKSTLAAVLAGLRVPDTGLVMLRGFDRQSVDSEVTPRRVAMAPQFHENYIFNATFGFNLLLGRRWPATEQDFADATEICRELGLDELLARMPLGMQQIVGESGWQLSHGERSRVFIARVLLQEADLVVLDESFGALDPETLRGTLETTLRRAPTLMVIAHP
jgi:ATP-binding cassette subfamily B protein